MSDVVRSGRAIQEVVYTVGFDTLRRAVLNLLNDEHAASFTDETVVQFFPDGTARVSTHFDGGEAA